MTQHEVQLNQQIRLMRIPDQKYPFQSFDIFQMKHIPPIPIDQIVQGQVIVRNLYISIDATMRIWISGVPSYLPPVKLQDVMRAWGVGRVIYSKSKKFKVGELVQGLLGWQKFAIVKQKQVNSIPRNYPHPEHFLGVFGISGLTAYVGLHEIGKIKASDIVVISAAAGAVGQIAIQLSKNIGCKVCGIAGSDDKCSYIKKLGADTAINYKTQNVGKRLKQFYPNGIDVYFDNVGGKMLDDIMMHIRNEARVVLCGLISTYNSKQPYKLKNYSRLIVKRAMMRGFLYFDYQQKFQQIIGELMGLVREGKLITRIDMQYGLEECPRALRRLLMGENQGKVIVKVDNVREKQASNMNAKL